LNTLEPKVQQSSSSLDVDGESQNQAKPQSEGDEEDGSPSSATSCSLCGLSFPSLAEQRLHVRSDLHGYNLKLKLRGNKPVGETEFERLVGDLDESLSGSDTSDTEASDDDHPLDSTSKPKESTLNALLKKQAKIIDGDAEDAPAKQKQRGSGKPPILWFSTPQLPSNTSLGIYRVLFSNEDQVQEDRLIDVLKQKQLTPKPPPGHVKPKKVVDDEEDGGVPLPASMVQKNTSAAGPHYFLCMIGGGHFAAMLVSLTPKATRKAGAEDRTATVIASKTFHRYTTRRKQGGSQSANDNAKGNAHSAGAGIRRYNETALVEEVRELLAGWRSYIDDSELLFIRATGTTNRRTLFGPYDDQVLDSRDPRLRGFPFSTRRATQSELMRSFIELTRVKVSTIDEVALARQAEEAAAAAAKAEAAAASKSKTSTPKPNKPTPQEEEALLHTTQLQALIRRSKAPAMVSYLTSNNLPPSFPFFPPDQNHHAPTPLHLAASVNSPVCVTALLLKSHADPTTANPLGKTPFDLAGDRATRDAFRLARHALGETAWPWDAAGVPPALTPTEVDLRSAREKNDQAAADAAEKSRRQAETERLRQEDAAAASAGRARNFGKAHVLGKPPMTAEERRAEEGRGMSEEMRMRVEREKRARAAEERMKRLAGGK
jgi:hypothetical protein